MLTSHHFPTPTQIIDIDTQDGNYSTVSRQLSPVKKSSLVRVALVGVCLTILASLFVLSGAGWALSDPDQRANGEEVTLDGTVVSTHPVTIDLGDGQQVVLEEIDSVAVTEGQSIAIDLVVYEPGSVPGEIEAQPWQRPFMYAISALAGLLVLGRAIDTWRVDVRSFHVEPREVPLHRQLLDNHRNLDQRSGPDAEPSGTRVETDGGTDD